MYGMSVMQAAASGTPAGIVVVVDTSIVVVVVDTSIVIVVLIVTIPISSIRRVIARAQESTWLHGFGIRKGSTFSIKEKIRLFVVVFLSLFVLREDGSSPFLRLHAAV
jgi:hypothetical protein